MTEQKQQPEQEPKKKKQKQQELKEFQQFAAIIHVLIGPFMVHSIEKHYYSGFELKEMGLETYKDEAIINEHQYIYDYPVQMLMNYARRVRRVFRRNKWDGVNEFLLQLKKKLETTTPEEFIKNETL